MEYLRRMKKRSRLISSLTIMMLFISIFAVPMTIYGETKTAQANEEYDYYISSTGLPQEYITVDVGETLEMGLYDAKTHKKMDKFWVTDREEPALWPVAWLLRESEDGEGEHGSLSTGSDEGSINRQTGVFKAKALGKISIQACDGLMRTIKSIDVYVGGYKDLHTTMDNQLAMPNPIYRGLCKAHAIAVGQKVQLGAIYMPGNHEMDSSMLKWELDGGSNPDEEGVQNNGIVRITQDGQIEGLREGGATLFVTVPSSDLFGPKKRVTIWVGTQYGIVTKSNIWADLGVGGTIPLEVVTFPEQSVNNTDWTWSSSDTSVATVDQLGKVKGVKEGEVQLFAKGPDGRELTYFMKVWPPRIYADHYTDFEYVLDDTTMTAKLTWHCYTESYSKKKKKIVPSTVEVKEGPNQPAYELGKYTITTLGTKAIDCLGTTSVVIPDTVTKIEDYAVGYQSAPPEYWPINPNSKCKDFTIYGYSENPESARYAKANGFRYVNLNSKEEEQKSSQTISGVNSFVKTDGDKAFDLNAEASGKGTLAYTSNDTDVVAVDSQGLVTIVGPGTATITITAAETKNFYAATKKVTIQVSPKKVTGVSAKAGKKELTVKWNKSPNVDGYQISSALDKNFRKQKKTTNVVGDSNTSETIKKLQSKKKYYVKVRAYKKTSGSTLFSTYSSTRSAVIK